MERLGVGGAVIEYEVHGKGEPVLLIPLSIVGDGLGCPLLAEPELASRYRLIHYHRRGYMGSTLGSEPLTASRQARDTAALLKHLGVASAHIAGHSFGGLIARRDRQMYNKKSTSKRVDFLLCCTKTHHDNKPHPSYALQVRRINMFYRTRDPKSSDWFSIGFPPIFLSRFS